MNLPDIGVPYAVRRSTRAKHLQAAVRKGQVEVVVPGWAQARHVRRFVDHARGWIIAKSRQLEEHTGTVLPERCESGSVVRLDGETVDLRVAAGFWPEPSIEHTGDLLLRVPLVAGRSPEKDARRLLRAWLVERVERAARHAIARFAPRLGVVPAGLEIKDQQTLWGSCGRHGKIHLNWRLVGAPPPVFDYIVVHELCHLVERNHGPKFWQLVAELMPGYEAHKSWLREHGSLLG